MQMTGLACAIPRTVAPISAQVGIHSEEVVQRIVENTGIKARRISPASLCTSDLCCAAADELLKQIGCARESIDAVVFVTQTPDFLIPSTSGIIQDRLSLSNDVLTVDVNQGCAGFTHGLILAQGLICGCGMRKVLLLAGDTLSKCVSRNDPGTAFLFGDAGSAALLESTNGAPSKIAAIAYGSDGAGAMHIHQESGYRNGFCGSSQPEGETVVEPNRMNLHLDGSHVFSFTIKRVPSLARQLLGRAKWSLDDVDAFLLHQANRFMLDYLARRIGIATQRMPLSLEEYGNTSSASIPLTMVTEMRDRLASPLKLLMLGFGVGLAWSGVALETAGIACPALVEIE